MANKNNYFGNQKQKSSRIRLLRVGLAVILILSMVLPMTVAAFGAENPVRPEETEQTQEESGKGAWPEAAEQAEEGQAAGPAQEEESKTSWEDGESGLTAEEWAKLQDHVLEYEELENRVAYFNPVLGQINHTIDDAYDDISSNIRDYQEAANDFEVLSDQAEDDGDIYSYMMYQINKKISMKMSSTYIDVEDKKGTTVDRSTRQYRKMFTSGCQQLMVAYNLMRANQATLEKQVQLYGAMADLGETQNSIGMATGTDVLTARANMRSAEISLAALEDQMASVKKSLLLMAGWDRDAEVEIGEIPKADVSQIDLIDLEADKQYAPGNNYTIISMRNTAPNDADGDGYYEIKDYRARSRSVEQAGQQLFITLDAVYENLFEKKAQLQAADTAFQAAQREWDSANRMYQLGMLGKAQYLGAELAYHGARGEYETADLNMTQALLNYYWSVNGLGELADQM